VPNVLQIVRTAAEIFDFTFNIMLVWLENAYSRPPFLEVVGAGQLSPKCCHSSCWPKKERAWAESRHWSHKPRISVARFELGVGTRKKGQDRKKS